MKKILILMAISAMFFTACEKYEISNPVNIDSFPKVLVTGVVRAEFDAKKGETPVPNGTVLVFSIPNSSYSSEATGKYIISTTTDANGKYSIEIPVSTSGVTATVSSSDFISTYTETENISYEKIYKLTSTTIGVTPEITTIQNLTFTGTEINEIDDENRIVPSQKSTLSGMFEYLSKTDEEGKVSYSNIPSGTEVKVKITLKEYSNPDSGKYEEYQTITVGNNGKYSVEVPMITDGKAVVELKSAINLEYTEYDFEGKAVRKYYRYSLDQQVYVYEQNMADKDFIYLKGDLIN